MNIQKYLMLGGVALSLGLSSCVGDLDLENIDPNYTSTQQAGFLEQALLGCYTTMAVSGQDGPGSSIISGLDNGTGQYTRALFMMNEFTTDEVLWIWKDAGVYDIVTNTFDATNTNVQGTYSRLYAHIGVCNQFIYDASARIGEEGVEQMIDEARALRAMSYYWSLDIFGNATLVTEPGVAEPEQATRAELYKWLEGELVDLVDNGKLAETPQYGRVGKDGAEALLARLYLNAGVYCGTPAWDKCAERCQNIIRRHQGGGFQGSGLAENYLYLFCRNNAEYMPGGGNKAENEILWGLAYDALNTQTYGGTTFLINSTVSDDTGMSGLSYGCSNAWKCMKARKELSERFVSEPNDARQALWVRGKIEATNADGSTTEYDYTIDNTEFSTWNSGYIAIKWNGLTHTTGGNWDTNVTSTQFASTDLAFIRLSDVYLMYAECAINGGADRATATTYVNYVRNRAGVSSWTQADLTADNLLDERSRELYYELTRRSDLIRNDRYVGGNQMLWSWKGNVLEGNMINSRYALMPIPQEIINAQPSFKQNPGY